MITSPPLASIAVALSLAACGGGGGDPVPEVAMEDDPNTGSTLVERDDREGLEVRFPEGADPETLTSPWLAVVDVFQNAAFPTETGGVFVELIRYTPGLTFRTHGDFYTEATALDTCTVDMPDDGDGEEDTVDPTKRSVNGGDAVTLSSAGGTWLDVPYSRQRSAYVYDADEDGFSGPMPEDLTLSLTGAEFPAVDALPLGLPDAPRRLSPAIGEAVGSDTEYRWMPEDDGAIVRLVFVSVVGDEFRGFPVDCRLRDDGAFELPEDVLAALSELPGTTTVRYSRELNRIEFRDGIAVFQSVEVADD